MIATIRLTVDGARQSADRQWQLLHLIDRPSGVTVEGAARELGYAVRTIWRDLTVLQRAGFPIYDEKGGDGHRSVWRVEEGSSSASSLSS